MPKQQLTVDCIHRLARYVLAEGNEWPSERLGYFYPEGPQYRVEYIHDRVEY